MGHLSLTEKDRGGHHLRKSPGQGQHAAVQDLVGEVFLQLGDIPDSLRRQALQLAIVNVGTVNGEKGACGKMQPLEGPDVVRGRGCEVNKPWRPLVVAYYAVGLDAALLPAMLWIAACPP